MEEIWRERLDCDGCHDQVARGVCWQLLRLRHPFDALTQPRRTTKWRATVEAAVTLPRSMQPACVRSTLEAHAALLTCTADLPRTDVTN